MDNYELAIDIGASGGRHILGGLDENGKLCLTEVYRFKNGMMNRGGSLCWDLDLLFSEILEGMRRCKALGKAPRTVGIDTWGVDYVLLDENDAVLGETFAYRDGRTERVDAQVSALISEEALYASTGIQKQPFNTIYQLWAGREDLAKAKRFLMIPEYFNFLLCGVKQNEYTNATTTGLVSAKTHDWDWEIINKLGYPASLFGQLAMPGTYLGPLRPKVAAQVGYDCGVVLPATHDTASAVAASPIREGGMYISSGTWSLMGVETLSPVVTEKSRLLNLTNEGGWDYRFRYLKNIMGLWMLQSVRAELGGRFGYDELAELAEGEKDFNSVVDAGDNRFLAPESMMEAIRAACQESGQAVPETPGQLAKCVYLSLAQCYADTLRELEGVTGRRYTSIAIVGGGCREGYLNRLTAAATGLTVYAGPSEATALGNILAQMKYLGLIGSLEQGRALIIKSMKIQEVRP